MKQIRWSKQKNETLKIERGVSFKQYLTGKK